MMKTLASGTGLNMSKANDLFRGSISSFFMTFLLVGCIQEDRQSGQRDYMTFCASCHGPRGSGEGPSASEQVHRPANLTLIAERHGGVFPENQVMGRIYGYTMGASERGMPQFGELLEGEEILYAPDGGAEIATSVRLVYLMQYVKSLQKSSPQ